MYYSYIHSTPKYTECAFCNYIFLIITQLIREAAQCASDEDFHLDIDDVEFIGDTVPPLLSVITCTSTTQPTCKLPLNVMDMLQKVVEWKQKFEVSCKEIFMYFSYSYIA